MTPERIVSFCLPFFALASAWITGLVIRYFPGAPHLDRDQLTALMSVIATTALVAGFKWMHERSKQNLAKRPVPPVE